MKTAKVYEWVAYDVLQILRPSMGKWEDYYVLKDMGEASIAKRKVDDAPKEFRITRDHCGKTVVYPKPTS